MSKPFRRFRSLLLFSLMAAPGITPAASFDCGKARTPVEQMICSDSELGKLDEALAVNFRNMLSADIGASKEDIRAEQRRWLGTRDKCQSTDCLVQVYRQRLDETCEYGVVSGAHPPCTMAADIPPRGAKSAAPNSTTAAESAPSSSQFLAGRLDSPQVQQLAQQSFRVYKSGSYASIRKLEDDCWRTSKASLASDSALKCGTIMVSGGLIDQAYARQEGRGPMPGFSPSDQRKRFLDRARALNLNEAQSDVVLKGVFAGIEDILSGLMLAGMR